VKKRGKDDRRKEGRNSNFEGRLGRRGGGSIDEEDGEKRDGRMKEG
jgi:hypothetical protein